MVTKGCGYDGKWWGREVVRKGSGDEGKWWRREVMMKGSGDEGKWWGREVVEKGSGDEGKWWRREVMMKGSGDEGKWWGREVVTKGSGDEGKWWRREVVKKGSDDVASALCWGGSWSTKPCVFPCKVAAAGDERYLVCAAVAAAVVCAVPSMCFATMVVPVCVVLCVSWSGGCGSHWNGCMNVAWAMFWGGSRSTKPCVFPCKVAAGDDERYLVCAAGAAGVVSCANWFLLCVLQRVVEWLWICAAWFYAFLWISGCGSHWNGCMNVAWAMLWGGSRSTKPCVFPCKVAAGDDERYLVCATGAAAVVSCANWFLLCVLQRVVVSCACSSMRFLNLQIGCRLHWNGCVNVAWAYVVGRKPEHETLCFSV